MTFFRKPASTPAFAGGRLFRDHALGDRAAGRRPVAPPRRRFRLMAADAGRRAGAVALYEEPPESRIFQENRMPVFGPNMPAQLARHFQGIEIG